MLLRGLIRRTSWMADGGAAMYDGRSRSLLPLGILVVVSLVSSCGGGQSAQMPPVPAVATSKQLTAAELYDLRAKCGRDAREWFKHFFGNGDSRGDGYEGHSSYSNHYDPQSNRCIALVGTTGFLKDAKTGKLSMSDARTLIDVNENKELGNYFKFQNASGPMQCNVGDKPCASQGEWESFVRPYTEP
jgi:hypothetical protein